MSQRFSSRFRRRGVSSSRLHRHRPGLEILEFRQLLATDTWISPTSGSWDVASNWSTGKVPGQSDDVVINVSGASPTVTISSNVESVKSITADDPLVISGGGLTVAANSTISGGLSMTGGSLTASGIGVTVNVTGTASASGASLYAEGGATLTISQLVSYTGSTTDAQTIEATGTGSELSLPALTTITGGGNGGNSYAQFEALSGGDVELGSLTTISGGAIWVESDGTGSVLDAPALTSATGGMEGGYRHGFQASDGGTLMLPVMASCTVQTITVQGASLSLPDLSDIDGSSITVSAGSHLTLPAVTSYTARRLTRRRSRRRGQEASCRCRR